MGSLFQLRDYWYTSFTGEEFSPSAVTLADPDVNMLFDKIVIGSFQGVLRILNPSSVQGPMMPGDVLFEKQYGEPILQLECGPFRPFQARSPNNLLVVLFPRALIFLEVLPQGTGDVRHSNTGGKDGLSGEGNFPSPTPAAADDKSLSVPSSGAKACGGAEPQELGVFYTLAVHSEIYLEHTAYNFASGNFGRIDYNMICVQSMDGLLTIADHNSVLYRSFFPPNQFLIPGPLTYCAYRDTFLTSSSSMFLLCYSYSSIVNNTIGAGDGDTTALSGSFSAGSEVSASRSSSLRPMWAFNLGEDAVDIAVCRLTRGLPREQADIVVLCSTILYIMSETGVPRMIRRLDVEAASLCVYPLPEIQFDNLLVGTFNGLVQVYSDTELEWSAAVGSGAAPLHLSVATFCGVEGMILNLSSDSTLTINYLGTDPVAQRPQALDSKTASYPELVHDLKQAEQFIQALTEEEGSKANDVDPNAALLVGKPKNDKTQDATKADAPAVVVPPSTSVPKNTGPAAELTITSEFSRVNNDENAATLAISLQTLATGVEEVTIVVQAVAPLLVSPTQHRIPYISSGSSASVSVTVQAKQDADLIIPSSLEVSVVTVYRGQRREHQSVQHVALAPLPLVAHSVPPMKNTSFSLQINTDKSPPPSLVELFEDMTTSGNVAANVLSVHYLNGADATVLVSKNAARFKLQGSTMEGLWLLASEVLRRLRTFYSAGGEASSPAAGAELQIEIPDEVPLVDFLAVVDTHWAIRKEMAAAVTGLDEAADLFRAVEKRLLARFRDRNPADSTAITVLFQESYKLLQVRANAVTSAKRRLRQACAMLNCCAQLTWLCMEVKATHMAPEDAATLRTLFRCAINDNNDVGWEEVTEAVLAKVLDVQSKKVASTTLELASNTVTLKAHVRTLLDTMQSGRRLSTK